MKRLMEKPNFNYELFMENWFVCSDYINGQFKPFEYNYFYNFKSAIPNF